MSSTLSRPIAAGRGQAEAIHGSVASGFEPLHAAFEENFSQRGEVGAALCVYLDGHPVVDLYGGLADTQADAPWQEDTVGLIFSATKALTAITALMLAEQGLLDLEAPVADYWPEFAAAGKSKVVVRQLLTHQAGLLGFTHLMGLNEIESWHPLVEDLAAQAPGWEPGTAHGYHAYTFGWLVGEVVRRISGLTPGAYLRRHVCDPLDLDLWYGLPASERHRYAAAEQNFKRSAEDSRGYEYIWRELGAFAAPGAMSPFGQRMTQRLLQSGLRPRVEKATARRIQQRELSDPQRAFQTMLLTVDDLNSDRGLSFEFPAGNAVCTARSLAKLYAALVGEVDGRRILNEETIDRARQPWAHGLDRVYHVEKAYGLGFMVPGASQVSAWGPGAFGHYGNGGSTGLADVEHRVALGYVVKRITPLSHPVRANALIEALYRCLQ